MNLAANELTIIIVLYEEEKNLVFQCLENIKNFKIIIVDNAANIFLKKKIEEKYKIYKYILNKKNCGFTKAANQAIKQCDTEYILNLNADCFIKNEDVLKLIKSHKQYKNCFITTPTFYDKESKLSYNAGFFAEKISKQLGISQLKITSNMYSLLQSYNWPGNIRELEHVISRAALKAKQKQWPSDIIKVDEKECDLGKASPAVVNEVSISNSTHPSNLQHALSFGSDISSLKEVTDEFQKNLIQNTLQAHNLNWAATARTLKLDRANLVRLAKRLGITVKKSI